MKCQHDVVETSRLNHRAIQWRI